MFDIEIDDTHENYYSHRKCENYVYIYLKLNRMKRNDIHEKLVRASVGISIDLYFSVFFFFVLEIFNMIHAISISTEKEQQHQQQEEE